MDHVYVVTEGYGEWELVGVYENVDDAKALAPESDDWREERGIIRNWGGGRDLFIQRAPLNTPITPWRDGDPD